MEKSRRLSLRDEREAIEFQKMDNQTVETVSNHIRILVETYSLNKNRLILGLIKEWNNRLRLLQEKELITNN